MTHLPALQRRQFCAAAALVALGLSPQARAQTVAALERAARAEGKLVSVGMPDDWANWKDTWADLNKLYGLAHEIGRAHV